MGPTRFPPDSLDQAGPQTRARAQPRLDRRHLPVILFVVVPDQMQQPVQRQHPKLGAKRVAGRRRLPRSNTNRDSDVPEKGR